MTISRKTLFGRILRLPLDLIPPKTVLPILRGRMKGMKWVKGAGAHGYWLGRYEMVKRLAVEKGVKRGDIFYDIGANVGYFSLLAAKLSAPDGRVVAFEPLPRNIAFIQRHIALNKLQERIVVVEAAVSDHSGTAFFDPDISTSKGHIAEQGQLEVKLVCLDELVKTGEIPLPDVMKIDVEGAEAEVLRGAMHTLQACHPLLYLDTHQREAHYQTLEILTRLCYTITCLDGKPLSESKELIARFEPA